MAKKTYIKRIALSMVLLIILALAVVYIWSTAILNKTYPVPLTEVHVPKDAASVKEGARLVQIEHCGAGFEKRILYGSDEMNWPQGIELSIKNVREVPFLTQEQKRDIFYNNAVRFFKPENLNNK